MPSNDTGTAGPGELPQHAAEAEHGLRVHAHIAAAIGAAGGWLSFEAYMELALYAPGLGYYSAGAHKFGAAGDFVTAPEISPLFGACIASQCTPLLASLPDAAILEIGAGSGRLAGDILGYLAARQSLPARYWILEISADLRERQREHLRRTLPHCFDRVVWLDAPPPISFDGVVLANEVLDALPVARFRWTGTGIEELGVALAGRRLVWSSRPAADRFASYCERLRREAGPWDAGYESEFCPRLPAWTSGITAGLRRGAVLWFDYGLPRKQYYLAERRSGTLLCHHRQQVREDPLQCPGLQDITAWVDFSALAEAGREAGFRLAGFTTQAHFLAACGIDREMRRIAGDDQSAFASLANQARRLMLPGEMGERFKAMAWMRGIETELAGFALRDFRDSL